MKMMSELCAAYKSESGNNVNEMYGGNIGQLLAQIEAGSGVSVMFLTRARWMPPKQR